MKCRGKSAKIIEELVKSHLSNVINDAEVIKYENNDMQFKTEKVLFKKNLYTHIFSKQMAREMKTTNGFDSKNIVPYVYLAEYREEIINYIVDNNISLHTYYNHFNSSQGLVLNFLGPIIATHHEKDFSKYVFGYAGILKIEHEMSDQGSHSKSRSEIDFTITSGEKLHLFEAKYTEKGFGKAKISNDNYNYDLNKYSDKWDGDNRTNVINNPDTCVQYNLLEKEIMIPISLGLVKNETNNFDCKETYAFHYQLIRNLYNTYFHKVKNKIVHRDHPGKMHIVTLADNLTHCKIIERFKKLLTPKYQGSIVVLTWQDLCRKAIDFADSVQDKKLKKHYKLFQQVFLNYDR